MDKHKHKPSSSSSKKQTPSLENEQDHPFQTTNSNLSRSNAVTFRRSYSIDAGLSPLRNPNTSNPTLKPEYYFRAKSLTRFKQLPRPCESSTTSLTTNLNNNNNNNLKSNEISGKANLQIQKLLSIASPTLKFCSQMMVNSQFDRFTMDSFESSKSFRQDVEKSVKILQLSRIIKLVNWKLNKKPSNKNRDPCQVPDVDSVHKLLKNPVIWTNWLDEAIQNININLSEPLQLSFGGLNIINECSMWWDTIYQYSLDEEYNFFKAFEMNSETFTKGTSSIDHNNDKTRLNKLINILENKNDLKNSKENKSYKILRSQIRDKFYNAKKRCNEELKKIVKGFNDYVEKTLESPSYNIASDTEISPTFQHSPNINNTAITSKKGSKLSSHRRANSLATHQKPSADLIITTTSTKIPETIFKKGKNSALTARLKNKNSSESTKEFLNALTALVVIAQTVIDTPGFEILANPQKCQKYIAKIQYYGSKWETNKDWPCKKLYLRFLLAIAALNRISEWWYEEKNKKSSNKTSLNNYEFKTSNSLNLFIEQSSPYIVDNIPQKTSKPINKITTTGVTSFEGSPKNKNISKISNKNHPKVDSIVLKCDTKNCKIQFALDESKILSKKQRLINMEAENLFEFKNKIKLKEIFKKLKIKTQTNPNTIETHKIENFKKFGQGQLNADLMMVSIDMALLFIYPFNKHEKTSSADIKNHEENTKNLKDKTTYNNQKTTDSKKYPKSRIFCHICEQMINIIIFEQHASICSSMHRATMDIQICHDGISELKTNLEQPSKEDIEQFESLGLKEEFKYVKLRVIELINKFLSMLDEYSIPTMDVEDIEKHIIKSCSIENINEFDFLEIINNELMAFFSTSISTFPSNTNITKYLSTSSKLITSLIDSMIRYRNSVLAMAKTENCIVQDEKTEKTPEMSFSILENSLNSNNDLNMSPKNSNFFNNTNFESTSGSVSRNNSIKSNNHHRRSRSQSVSINNIINQPSISDYTIIKPISKGAYGSVFLAKKKSTQQYYAIKVLKKSNMVLKNQTTNIKAERLIMMSQPENPFVVKLYSSFQTTDNLYLVMEYLNGGDCASLLKNMGCLEEEWTKSYIAEMVLGIGNLHSSGIAHRDLKPDNFLINKDGHLKLIDFGLSKIGFLDRQFNQGVPSDRKFITNEKSSPVLDYIWASSPPHTPSCNIGNFQITHTSTSNETSRHSSNNTTRCNTPVQPSLNYNNTEQSNNSNNTIKNKSKKFVGTPDYLAPESILGTDLEATIDWWALGVITYEFLYGIPPFHSSSIEQVFEKIILGSFQFPDEPYVSEIAKDFIKKLLNINPKERLGYNGVEEIKSHPFLMDTDWDNLGLKDPFFIPNSENLEDTDYFDKRGVELTNMKDMFPELYSSTSNTSPKSGNSPNNFFLKENNISLCGSLYSSSNPNSEFGSFMYKNLPLLEKQNEDALKKIQPNQYLLRRGPNNSRSRKGSIHEMLRPNSISFSENFSNQRPDRSDSISSKSSIKSDHTDNNNVFNTNKDNNKKQNPIKVLQKRGRTQSTDFINNSKLENNNNKMNTNESKINFNNNNNNGNNNNNNNNNLKAFSTDSIEINTKKTHFTFLVADDNPLNRRIMQILLGVIPSNIILCEDGAEAIAYSRTTKYDIIFMDINMPNFDGNNAAKFIKLSKNENKSTPIVAIAHKSIDSMFIDFYDMVIDNPITKNVIHRCLNSLLD